MSISRFNASDHAVCRVRAYRVSSHGPALSDCSVIVEDALTLDIEGVGLYTLMWTPTVPVQSGVGFTREDGLLGDRDQREILSIAAGFAFTEGIIDGIDAIRTMSVCPENPSIVRMQLVDPEGIQVQRRNVVVTSSCGVCGGRDVLESNLLSVAPVPDTMRIEVGRLSGLMAAMRQHQWVFMRTGGAHAAAIFAADETIIAAAEDLGRHNALDKVIGRCLLNRTSLDQCGVLLSSRLSLEMLSKVARAGIQVVAAVSAPTSLAIELAERVGVTLCGFVRDGDAVVYTHPQRVVDVACGARRH